MTSYKCSKCGTSYEGLDSVLSAITCKCGEILTPLTGEMLEAMNKIKEPDELDCQQNILPKCPHCGHDHDDYTDYAENGTYECEKCGKKFIIEVEQVVIFNTRKV